MDNTQQAAVSGKLQAAAVTARPGRVLAVIAAIGRVTFQEILRDKLLYNVLLTSAFLLFMGMLATQLNIFRPEKVVLDFGLLTVDLTSAMIAIFIGSGLIPKEFEKRTIYLVWSHPIERYHFILGKFVGLSAVLILNWLMQVSVYLLLVGLNSSEFFLSFSWTLFWALINVVLRSQVWASVALAFSALFTTSLSVICSIGFAMISSNVSQLLALAEKKKDGMHHLLKLFCFFFPNLENLSLAQEVSYSLPIPASQIMLGFASALSLMVFFLMVASQLVRQREA